MNSLNKDSGNNYTLYIDQGTTFKFSVPFNDLFSIAYSNELGQNDTALETRDTTESILVSTGDSLNLVSVANLEFYSTIKQHQTSKKSYDFNATVNQAQFRIDFILPPDISSGLKWPRYQFDIMIKNTLSGEITRSAGGSVIVTPNFTNL